MSHAQDREDERRVSRVTIDRNFVRQEAREAVKQFFRPITAPFETVRSTSGEIQHQRPQRRR